MLTFEGPDRELEDAMKMAADELLKAKSTDERETAARKFETLHKIYNERLKIQVDRDQAEEKLCVEKEKLEREQVYQAEMSEKEKKDKRVDRAVKIGLKVVEFGLVGAGLVLEVAMLHHNTMAMDPITKGNQKNILQKIGGYLNGNV